MFYLTKQSSQKDLDSYIIFLEYFYIREEIELKLICESELNFNYIEMQLKNKSMNVDLFCIEKHYSKNYRVTNNDIIKFKEIVLKKKYDNIDNNYNLDHLYQLAKIIYDKLDSEINKETKRFLIINQGAGIFRSVPLVMTQEISYILDISIILPFQSPLKGRLSIYESIYFHNKAVVYDYNDYLNKDSLPNYRSVMNYFNDHIQYQNDSSIRKNIFSRNDDFLKSVLSKILLVCSKIVFSKIFFDNKKKLKPYILVMLTKKKQWFCSFANQNFIDRYDIIKNIRNFVPVKYDVVLRFHPLDRKMSDFKLLKFIASRDDIKISLEEYKNENLEIINNSEMVISYGSSSIILALMLKKNCIELGKKSLFFPMINPPISQIHNWNDLKNNIYDLINKKISHKNIYSYLFSIYKNSFPVNQANNINKQNPFEHSRTRKNTAELVDIIYNYLKINNF